jgi:hypothetical protein
LIRPPQQRRWNRKAEGLRGLEVHEQLEPWIVVGRLWLNARTFFDRALSLQTSGVEVALELVVMVMVSASGADEAAGRLFREDRGKLVGFSHLIIKGGMV